MEPYVLPPEGVAIPLLASFTGLRGVPLLSLSRNSINPALHLHPDRVVYRVVGRRTKPLANIRQVTVMTAPFTRNVDFEFLDSMFSFTANVKDDAWRLWLLRQLQERGVPLAPKALGLLAANR